MVLPESTERANQKQTEQGRDAKPEDLSTGGRDDHSRGKRKTQPCAVLKRCVTIKEHRSLKAEGQRKIWHVSTKPKKTGLVILGSEK